MSTPSRPAAWTRTLDDAESKVGRALAGGHIPSLAKAIMGHQGLREAVVLNVLDMLDSECSALCRRTIPLSLFCKVPLPELEQFQWDHFIGELQNKAPTLLQILSTITSHNDHRNKLKSGRSHYPGICMAAALVLRERNQRMTGLQSIIALILFASHVDKQVRICTAIVSVHTYMLW